MSLDNNYHHLVSNSHGISDTYAKMILKMALAAMIFFCLNTLLMKA